MLFLLFLVRIHISLHFNLGTRETRLLNSQGFVNLPIYYISLLYFVAFVYHYTSFMFHFLDKNWCTLIRQISTLILISPPTALYSFIYLEIVILITPHICILIPRSVWKLFFNLFVVEKTIYFLSIFSFFSKSVIHITLTNFYTSKYQF